MIVIGKKGKVLAIIGFVLASVLSLAAVFLLFVTNDGSTTAPAIVIFSIAAVFVLIAVISLSIKPNTLILYDKSKKSLLIDRRGCVAPEGLQLIDTTYYSIPLADVIVALGSNEPDGGSQLFGAVVYAATVKSLNRVKIKFMHNGTEAEIVVRNLTDAVKVARKVMDVKHMAQGS